MSDSTVTVLRAGVDNFALARQAIGEINLSTATEARTLDEAALSEFLADRSHYLLIAVEYGQVVGSLYGYALLHPYHSAPQFFLYGMDVRPECRNRGIGTALVKQFAAEGRRAGAFEMWVLTGESNKGAMAMYAKAGMKRENPDDVMLVMSLRE